MIIPAYNEERRLPASLAKIDAFLQQQPYGAEVIVVDNGSTDRTVAVASEFAASHHWAQVIQASVRGKGLAVKVGMQAACGDFRFICDADLSMPIEEIAHFLPPHSNGFDVQIATREGQESRRIGEPFHRHLMGRIFNRIIQWTALPGMQDTQCGFKMFNRAAADDLFSVQQMVGIGFDVELLFIARKRGNNIREVPVTWSFDADSRMRLIYDSLYILLEIQQIHRNWQRGFYARPGS
ncbi:MAG: glycosyltransferase family 2 protein [Anaerolineae bacterium]|nr:glycosyltransferase family 2 protein [Anaerolineae bacterium]